MFFVYFSVYLFCIAFWGESDDSYAEIEAALRPQPFNANNDDTDGFYD